jgi:hypothetical protein
MDRRTLTLVAASALMLTAPFGLLSAQSDYTAKLMGTWVMDSTNGPGDHGLPKSETLVFSRGASGFTITSTSDEGKAPSTGSFDCMTAGAGTATAGSSGTSVRCTIRVTSDSVIYAIDAIKDGKVTPVERGRLVVSSTGRDLRDEYNTNGGTSSASHHRHIYDKRD